MTCTDRCQKPSMTQCHCSVCHVTFRGVDYFDTHRVGARCKRPETFGLTESDGVWGKSGTLPPEAVRRIKGLNVTEEST